MIFTVTNTSDNILSAPVGSLRAAIIAANLVPGSSVVFQAALSGTITLGGALPQITTSMSIDATGATIVVDGASLYTPFSIDASGLAVTINLLTIDHGSDASSTFSGAIDVVHGIFTLTNCTIRNSLATIPRAAISIALLNNNVATGAVSISNCTFLNNAGSAVAMYGASATTVTNCTLNGNNFNDGTGVLYYRFGDSNIVRNCTFSANSNIAIGVDVHSVTVVNCICYGDSGGELRAGSNGATMTVSFSDIQGGIPAGVTDGGNNISTDPTLSSLASNGGPTQTMAITSASTAYKTGTATGAPATDQRGVTRPTPPSMGAFDLADTPSSSSSAGSSSSMGSSGASSAGSSAGSSGASSAASSVGSSGGSSGPTPPTNCPPYSLNFGF